MRYLLIFLLTIIFLPESIGQDSLNCDCYDRLTNLSEYYEQKGDIEKAIEVYEKGMKFKKETKWIPYEYFKLGELHTLNGNFKSACKYLEEALKMGFDIEYLDYEKFDSLKKSPNWAEMVLTIDSLKRDYQKNINLEYRLALEDIRGSDQTIRRLIKVPDTIFHELDSINYLRVLDLINKYGYPDMETHGFDGTQNVYLVLLHASMYSEDMYQEILGILNQAIENCSYDKSSLAQFIDRREVWYHKKEQIYGRWNSYRASEFKKIRDLKSIDIKRFDYNLLRLKEQALIEKRTLPNGYKEDSYPENYFCGYIFIE